VKFDGTDIGGFQRIPRKGVAKVSGRTRSSANTIEAYGRDLDCYLGFLETENIPFHLGHSSTIGAYIRSITQLEVPRVSRKGMEARSTLANATLQQHLTVVRLFHDFLVE